MNDPKVHWNSENREMTSWKEASNIASLEKHFTQEMKQTQLIYTLKTKKQAIEEQNYLEA